MRIGLIAPPWIPVPPPAYGGIEAVMDVLARGLSAADHEVVLVASSDSRCPVELVPGTAISNAGSVGSCADELRHAILAYKALSDVDVIHDNTLAGAFYRRRPSEIPVVVTAHGPFSGALRSVYQDCARDASLIAISHHQARTAPKGSVTRTIHHGIDTTRIGWGQGHGGYACFLGRMDPAKGVKEAIEVARLAGMPLRIAAKMRTVAEHEYFDTVVRPLLGAGIEYVGEVNAEEKYQLLREAVALLNPIQWDEPFGMVMIESLSAGTPVIATSRGSAPEIVQEGVTGHLRTTITGLAAALESAPALNRTICRASVEARFSAERMVQKHLTLYGDLLRSRTLPNGASLTLPAAMAVVQDTVVEPRYGP
ncbi:glycosyltransferase family 4 protein [Arthrobacter psychrolactophilus]|uniref:Glycosyltransferase family 4 protein n=1 Tax=Arthrobacter psychrolactophilus TaxID=92442 RepID=A0A2V5IKS0_9MICC|nr:glycosyltransferase family 4 protein [Arthrobacter psychrolactophilus]PYI37259.1 glycosyltransferase family 4 protein [Arthrobacter psychrolactophilus]